MRYIGAPLAATPRIREEIFLSISLNLNWLCLFSLDNETAHLDSSDSWNNSYILPERFEIEVAGIFFLFFYIYFDWIFKKLS